MQGLGRVIAKDPERFIRNDYWMDWMTPATTGNNTRITMTKEGKTRLWNLKKL